MLGVCWCQNPYNTLLEKLKKHEAAILAFYISFYLIVAYNNKALSILLSFILMFFKHKTHFTQCTATSICTVSFDVTALIVLFSLTDLVVYSCYVGPTALDLITCIFSPQILFILKLIISPDC